MQRSPDSAPDPAAAGWVTATDDLADWRPLQAWPSVAEAHEYALVALAMGKPCAVYEHAGAYWVFVDVADADAVAEEWRAYEEETQQGETTPRRAPESQSYPMRLDLAMLWVLTLLIVFTAQGRSPVLSDRFLNSTSGLMRDGEWWRPFTALFLHADGPHLLGNALLGGVFCVLVAHAVGAIRGWLLIFACGTLANATNAALRMPGEFYSLGASTATFAALGILVGHATRVAWLTRSFLGFRMLFVPLIAGGILLGWFGGGGADAGNVDVAGHVLGWLFGVVAGFFLSKPKLVDPPGRT